ncbi:MAG: DUF6036 family nucleotidyltransferase [Terriglobales bacterium]
MPDLVVPSPWPQFLSELDRKLAEAVEIHCAGGFALTAVYGISRTTADLDYISAIPIRSSEELDRIAGRDSGLARKFKVYLQFVRGVTDFPEDYEARLTTVPLGLKRLALRVLEPYDLVLSKLTRNSPKDAEDVRALARKLDLQFEVAMTRFRKEMSWVPNMERHQQTMSIFWRDFFPR